MLAWRNLSSGFPFHGHLLVSLMNTDAFLAFQEKMPVDLREEKQWARVSWFDTKTFIDISPICCYS